MLSQNRDYQCFLLFCPAKRLLIQVSELWMLLLVCVATSLQMLTYFSALIIWKCNNLRIRNGRSKHNAQQREIKFKQIPHRNHDRFLFIDNEVYLLGASDKDMSVGLCAITKMRTTPETVLGLLGHTLEKILKMKFNSSD